MSALAHLQGHGIAHMVAVRENAVIIGVREAAKAGAARGSLVTILLGGAEGVCAHAVNCWSEKIKSRIFPIRWGGDHCPMP